MNGEPDRAIDGDPNTSWGGQSCTHTDLAPGVDRITVTARLRATDGGLARLLVSMPHGGPPGVIYIRVSSLENSVLERSL